MRHTRSLSLTFLFVSRMAEYALRRRTHDADIAGECVCNHGRDCFAALGLLRSVCSYSCVEGDCNARSFSRVRVNLVIEPAREHHKQSRLWPNSKGLSVWVARCAHGFRPCPRVEKFQYATEWTARIFATTIYVIHS